MDQNKDKILYYNKIIRKFKKQSIIKFYYKNNNYINY